MKRIFAALFAVALLGTGLLSACASTQQQTPSSPSGEVSVESSGGQSDTDAVTSASVKESSDPDKIVNGLSDSGYWIFALLGDVTLRDELVVSGEFHNRGDAEERLYRKFSLYSQDEQHQITAEYTLTVPKMTVLSPCFRIQNGTVKGDVFVDAEGFELFGCTVDGDLTFKTQEQMDSADIGTGKVSGTVSVG